eukprot:CAMPEP_0197435688 /NCGR_PEP_ID=MMETSP1175-20131217/3249_1 /TAXON_ID=1003142 /ORGANISM="Triceratium dubium, Strain CCMP147" /LENGTH=551 /DNA_ID=CAMNT_0042964791 /DNA_START=137 /DNA_END=1792 /DNA_ORIENTATION=+
MTDSTFDLEVTLNDFKKTEKQFSASKRAQRRWRLLKNVRIATKRTSLTKSEKDLLHAMSKKKQVQNSTQDANVAGSENTSIKSKSGDSSAHRRLRDSMAFHRDSLSIDEVKFLQNLLDSESVSNEALNSANEVLQKDVIYKQKLSVGGEINVTGTANSRRRSSALSSSMANASNLSSVMASISELEPEETQEKDVAYRKELWRTRQQSTVSVQEDEEGSNESRSDEDKTPMKSEESLFTSFQESPLMNAFRKYIDSSSTLDTQATSSSDDEEEKKKDCAAKVKKTSQAPVCFSFLGTSPTDESVTGLHVMTPPLMDTIRQHLPYTIQEDNFWLKYSLAQDGASIISLLSNVRSSSHTILAIETTDGEVFGSFTSSPWRQMGSTYYGSCESFLWRMAKTRRTSCKTIVDRAELESDIEIFKWTGENRNIQMSNTKMLAVGGGEPDKVIEQRLLSGGAQSSTEKNIWADFGLALNSDFSSGSSGRCVTFGSSSGLSRNGTTFDVQNLEIWTLTPMSDIEQAEKLELGRQFVFNSIVTNAKVKPRQKTQVARSA